MNDVSMRDIARRAGVSVNTVSRAMNNKPEISPETTRKIQVLAHEMGYALEGRASRSRNTTRTRTIGIVVANIANPGFSTVVKGVEDVLGRTGYHLVVCNSDENSEKEKRILEALLESGVDGILITPCLHSCLGDIVEQDRHTPVVLVLRIIGGVNMDSVIADCRRGTFIATEHLIRLGHRDILFMNGSGSSTADDRLAGFKEAFQSHGLEPDTDLIRVCPTRMESAYSAMKSVLLERVRFTAVTSFNDIMMLGILKAVREAQLRVPEDISLVGFDNIDCVSMLTPPLTTVRMPLHDLGTEAATMLVRRLRGREGPEQLTLPVELVVRESTAKFTRSYDG